MFLRHFCIGVLHHQVSWYGMGANSGILAQAPHALQLICGESGIVPAAFVAILLNVLLPKDDKAV